MPATNATSEGSFSTLGGIKTYLHSTMTQKKFKLNWASKRAQDIGLSSNQQEYDIFVGDLSQDVTSQMLLTFFQKYYKSVSYAKVIEDENGVSKGYGFVRFTDESERLNSYSQLDGASGLGNRNIVIRPAQTPKSNNAPTMPIQDFVTSPNYTPPVPMFGYVPPSPMGPMMPASYWAPPPPPMMPMFPLPYEQPGYPGQQYTTQYPQSYHPESCGPDSLGLEEVDPCVETDVDQVNQELLDREKELFEELDNSLWQCVSSVT